MDRAEQELDILERISQIPGDTLELGEVFGRAMTVLRDRLGVQRAALVLRDAGMPGAGAGDDGLRIVAAVGLTPQEQERGRYVLGEGVTGRVMQTGEPAIIPDIARHPAFLNRTGARKLREGEPPPGDGHPWALADASAAPQAPHPISFLCVPVRNGRAVAGVISIDKPFESDEQLAADARLLTIIAGSFAQTIRIHQLMQLEKDQWLAENQALRDSLRSRYRFDNIVGSSPVMLNVLSTIGQVASSRATVLLLGEPGCGKELIAKAIHYNSPRKDRPMVRVNCGALPAGLLERELFGHVKGAFPGAAKDKAGKFEAAEGGTLFLDEVGTLDPQLQVKLLRVLQEREFERVGDHHTRQADVRVIAATHLDLEEEVRRGNFREDLYYRLNVVQIHLPPLRSRREDIPRLIDHFLDRYNRENQRNLHKLSRAVLDTLLRYPWPGNVRELENAIERAVVLSTGEEFTQELLPLQIRMFGQQTRSSTSDESIETLAARLAADGVRQYQAHEGRVYPLIIHEVERHLLREALAHNGGIKTRTADFLGINRNTLNKKVRELGIEG